MHRRPRLGRCLSLFQPAVRQKTGTSKLYPNCHTFYGAKPSFDFHDDEGQ